MVAMSAGTEPFNIGKGAHPTALKVAKEFGLDLSGHVARQVTLADIEWADHIILMDHENLSRLKKRFPQIPTNASVRLLGDCIDGGHADIPDPYRKNEAAFRSTYRLIIEACQRFIQSQFMSKDCV